MRKSHHRVLMYCMLVKGWNVYILYYNIVWTTDAFFSERWRVTRVLGRTPKGHSNSNIVLPVAYTTKPFFFIYTYILYHKGNLIWPPTFFFKRVVIFVIWKDLKYYDGRLKRYKCPVNDSLPCNVSAPVSVQPKQ